MTNRQARREQRRSQKNTRGVQRPRGGSGPSPSRGSSGGSGGSGFFSVPYLVGVGVLVLALGGIVVWLALDGGDDATVENLIAAEESFPDDMADGNAVGDPDAPVTVVSFIDFRCPHCLNFAAGNEPDIIDEYVRDGRVRLETRHMPVLGDGSVAAAEAAQCAARQDAFWPMHNKLFLEHAREGTGSGTFNRDAMLDYAGDIGLDVDEFESCMSNRDTNEEVQDDLQTAQSYGFSGTPSFLINDQPLTGSPSDIDGWRTILDDVLDDGDGDAEGDNGEGADTGDGATNGEDPADDEDAE